MRNLIDKLYSFEGRLARMDYFGLGWGTGILHLLAGAALAWPVYYVSETASYAIMGIVCAAYVVSSLSIAVRRLHDLNLSGWTYLWYILCLVIVSAIVGYNDPAAIDTNPLPNLINLIFAGMMLFVPGTTGTNNYGLDTLADWRDKQAAKWAAKAQRKAVA